MAFAALSPIRVIRLSLAMMIATAGQVQGGTIINVPRDIDPGSISQNDILNLTTGGTLGDYFASLDFSTVNIFTGTVGDFFEAWHFSTVNIFAGTVGDEFYSGGGYSSSTVSSTTVNISGGTLGNNFRAGGSGTVNISGGTFGNVFGAFDESTVNISGGMLSNFFDVGDASTVNISGGMFGNVFGSVFAAIDESTVNISGGAFNVAYGDYTANDWVNGSSLVGTLADGTPIDARFSLVDNATLTLSPSSVVPEPPSSVVPEPSSLAIFGIGALGLVAGGVRRRKQSKDQHA